MCKINNCPIVCSGRCTWHPYGMSGREIDETTSRLIQYQEYVEYLSHIESDPIHLIAAVTDPRETCNGKRIYDWPDSVLAVWDRLKLDGETPSKHKTRVTEYVSGLIHPRG